MKKISTFQIVVLAIFILFIIGGVAAFALYRGNTTSTAIPAVTIWGTFPKSSFDLYVSKINNTLAQPITVTYVQKSSDSFGQEFVAALARGTGPDGILLPADMLLPHYDKLALIPYTALDQRTFIDSYVDEAKIYLNDNGILALPFTIDPLVMYWNRDMFNAAGIATYPRYWDEFTGLSSKLTIRDQNGNIRKSAVALGDFANINNAREILGTLILQLGNPVTIVTSDGFAQSTLRTSAAASPAPALTYFAQFADPTSSSYAWNRGLPASKSAFLSGLLATYFGFASEIADIKSKNPNLNFDVASMPQIRPTPQNATSAVTKALYARLTGLSIVRASQVPNAVYQVISILTDPTNLALLNEGLYLPTVRRDVIAQGSKDPYITVFNQAALISKTWIDADPASSRSVFADMTQAVSSGSKTVNQAIQDAGDAYDAILKNATQ